jgi:UDP-N-acetylglucosamine 4,6-dehydratase
MLTGKAVLITGGTGSFGQGFVRSVLARYKPARLVVFSRDEQKQYEMRARFSGAPMEYVLGDVRDYETVRRAFEGMSVIVHAAALKQVEAAEQNPQEAIKTNINGSANVVTAAAACRIQRVIEISTDKAVHPVNIYGATKFVADKIFVSAGFSVARLGNFSSRGSVVPYFRRLAAEGAAELPVTDARMTRFWLTLTQAVEFVLACLERMKGGEIFVPRVPSVRTVDIAKAAGPSLKVKIVGIRPGERLHEILLSAQESARALAFTGYYVVPPVVGASDYSTDAAGERGVPVKEPFEYSSETNDRFLTAADLRKQEDFI